jgi:hypothetical protein
VTSFSGEDGESALFGPPAKPIEYDDASAGPNGKIRLIAFAKVRFLLE